MNLFENVNKDQQRAITAEGVVIIIAGPGTGKTKTLITRIQYLLQEKSVSPQEILALTFTKKAAAEIKERLAINSTAPYISTFHGLAFDILKQIQLEITIISQEEQKSIIKQLLEQRSSKKLSKKDVQELLLQITQFKNSTHTREVPSLVSEYNAELQKRGVSDYDDLLLNIYNGLTRNNKQIRKFTNRFKYILIDEFQDTNKLQYEIMKQLVTSNNLFVIGDPYQSIYAFRGAESEIFSDIKKDFPNFTEIFLTTNYRSTKEIITASSSLFPEQIKLKPFHKEKGEVTVVYTVNEYTEAAWIISEINAKIGGTDLIKAGEITEKDLRKTSFADFAVIYRMHSLSGVLEQQFINSGIPFQIIGDDSPFKQPAVLLLVSLLEYVYKPSQKILQVLVTSSIFELSFKTLSFIHKTFYNNLNYTLDLFLQDVHQHIQSKKDIKILSTFIMNLKVLDSEAKKIKLQELIHKITENLFLKEYLNAKHKNTIAIHMFMSTITQFYANPNGLELCVKYIQYLKDHEFYDQKSDKVTLLTMHASKGLEFKYVFICGFEEGIIPYTTNNTEKSIQEELRLFYVALTRAKNGLYLLSPKERNKKQTKLSQFYSIFKTPAIVELQDEAISKHKRKVEKWKDKKSQLQLF